MAFMKPQYTHGAFRITEHASIEADAYCESEHGEVYADVSGWFWRLSADGYMDCTDWSGPFDTATEARMSLTDTYDIDPDTGEELS